MTQEIRCAECKTGWSATDADGPCPNCGSSRIMIRVENPTGSGYIGEITMSIGVPKPERDYRKRLEEAEQEIVDLESGLSGVGTLYAKKANRRLHLVFVEIWSLREAVIHSGVSKKRVDQAIDAEPGLLGLAHDVGNLAKHGTLTMKARSGSYPAFGEVRCEFSGGQDWHLVSLIEHDGTSYNGIVLAKRALAEWRRQLVAWNLL